MYRESYNMNIKIFPFNIFFILTLFFMSTCASIVSNRNYPVTINSTPGGANFEIRNKRTNQIVESGITPRIVKLPAGSPYFRKNNYIIKYSMPGYEDKTEYLESGIDGWYWGNIAIGGLIGMFIVDPLTGAMYRIPVEYVDTTLNKTSKR